MEKLQEMITFARVVETKSFSGAAVVLGTSKSVVSKQVSQLEAALGVKLLNRTTRSMNLTDVGAAYYEHCSRILHEIEAANETVTQLQAEPRGILRVTSPVIFASLHLGHAIKAFLARYPKIEIELYASDRTVDLIDERYDLALRITDNPPPGMVARPLAQLRWAICAAPSYLKEHGVPQTPEDLLNHECLVYLGQPGMRNGWRFRINGKETNIDVKGRCRVNSSDALLRMALDGMGLVLFPTYVMGQYVKSGQLVEVLADSTAYPDMQLVAMYLPDRYMQPKVRTFIDHMMATFGNEPYWDDYRTPD